MDKFIQLLFVVFLNVLALSSGQCPDHYIDGPNGHCYTYYSLTSGTGWAYARSYCASTNNSDLVILDDQEEYEWVVNVTTTTAPNSSWWLGYHDSSVEGDWRWVDCSETNDWHRSLWSPDNPGNGREDCGVLLPTGEIDDIVCDIPMNYFLCEVSPKGFTPDEASPTNLRANVTSTLTVSLKWDLSPFNCDVFGYAVRVTDEQMKTTQEIVYGGDTSEVEVSVDRVRAEYSFTVAAWTINDGELPQTVPVLAMTGPCPDGFEESPGGRCYQFRNLTNGEWWPAGRRSCDNTEDGDLVIINDEEEWNYIRNRTSEIDPDGKWWIGLSDLTSDDDWLWLDCTESNDWQNRLWAPGYPTAEDTKDCAILYPDGTIQDDVCDLRIHSICEISPKEFDGDTLMVDDVIISQSSTTSLHVTWSLPRYGCDAVGYRVYYSMTDTMEDKGSIFVPGGDVTEAVIQDLRANTTYHVTVAIYVNKDYELGESQAIVGTTMACPVNYEEGPNGHCYWFAMTTYGYMWYWGRQDCSDEPDSDLVIIDDEEELNFLRNRTAGLSTDRNWWIGLSSSPEWSWIDCEEPNPWQDTLWAPGYPLPDSYGCALFNDSGQVLDVACDAKHHFICEIYPRGFSAEDQNVQDIEASPLTYGMEVSWTPAPKRCDVSGYRISYKEDVEGAREFFALQYGKDSSTTLVTGLYPNRTYNVTVAAFLITDVELSPVGPVQMTTLACPVNYEEGPNGHCYWFAMPTYGYMWHWGRQDCSDEPDSDLVIIDDEEEMDFLRNRTAGLSTDRNWWIGLSSSPEWSWIDCEEPNPWQDTLWAPGNPLPDSYGCALLNDSGQLLDVACDAKHHFICEIYPRGFSAEDQNVQDIEAIPLTYGMEVSWTPAPKRCDVDGYRIAYKEDLEGAREFFALQYGKDSTSTTVTGLYPNRTYNVTVAAFLITDVELSPVGPVQITTPPCPDNYEEGPNGHCYRFRILDNGTRWMRGRQTCDNVEDSDYVIIDDEEELSYLLNRSAEVDPDMTWWIGLSDLSMPGFWGWVDCSTLTPWQTGLWAPDYPTGQPSRCAAVQPDGGVIDLPCETRLSYLCELLPKGFDSDAIMVQNVTAQGYSNYIVVSWELPDNNCDAVGYVIYYQLSDGTGERKSVYVSGGASTSGAVRALTLGTSYSITVAVSTSKEMELQETATVNASTVSSCPANYEEGPNGHCYRFWLEDYGNWWTDSRQDCYLDVDFSDLLVINDQEEFDFVMNRTTELSANDSWWIGYTDQSVEGDWRWLDCQQSDTWQDSLWAPGYPMNNAHDCAVLQPTGEVMDFRCDERLRGFVCEISPREFGWQEANVQNLMATGITYGLEVTWTVSSRSCDVIGYRVTYQLDEPGSQSELMILYGGDVDGVTISGLLPDRRYAVGVGAILNLDAELSPVTTTGTTVTCPNNYEEGPNGHCYRFRILDDGSHWPTGRRTCDNVENSDLAIINDPEELSFLVNRSAEVNPDMTWWIGLSDLYIEGEWRWIDCSTTTPYQDFLWAPDNPTDTGLTCAALQPSGDIINLPCDRRFSYLCELYPTGFDIDTQVVENVRASGGMYTIDVIWDLPENGCNAVGYKIYYELTGVESDVLRSVYINGGDSVSGSITGLHANTSYDVKVAIMTSKDIELSGTEPVTVSTAACPDNYELGPTGHCYSFRLLDPGSFWLIGRRICDNEVDSDLVIINDEIEFDFLMNRTVEMDPNMTWWIGYTDQSIEGDWRWLDCETSNTFQRTLWAPGYPGNGIHDCAALRPSGDIVDLVCDATLSYICEISPKGFGYEDINPRDLAASGVTYGLEVTWTPSPTSCDVVAYRVTYQLDEPGSSVEFMIVYAGDASSATVQDLMPGRAYNVSVAAILNQEYELAPIDPVTATTLPCPGGYEEGPNGRCYRFRILDYGSWWSTGRRTCDNEVDSDLAIINDQVELDFLISRTAEINPDIMWWIGYSDQSVESDWRWIDCTESSAWQDELWVPGHPGNGRLDCAALQPDGQIVDLVCDTPLSYLCEVSPRGFSEEDASPSDLAVMGTTYGVEVTWTVSPTSCDVVGYRISYYVTGDISSRASTFVYGGDASSVVVRGLSVNTTYDVTVAAFISKDTELSPVGPVTATTDPCPDGYSLAPNGRCYLFIQDSLGSFWHYSRETCWGQKDSDLAIINDQDELDYIMQKISDIGDTKNWWLGYSDNSVEGEWKWVDCTESNDWQMNLWAPGSPGNEMLDCGSLSSSGEVEAQVCDMRLNFVCEVSPKGFDPMELKVENMETSGASYGVDVAWTLPENNCDAIGYKIYYQEMNNDSEQFKIIYGGDSVGTRIQGLLPNTTLSVSVAVVIVDDELERVGPIIGQSDPCPTDYEEAANGRCYWFQDFGRYGNDWVDARYYCSEAAENFDHDLMIIDDEWELEYITNRTKELNDSRDWRIGYSDLAEEGVWKWVTCESPDTWQLGLWAPGYPQNGQDDCGVFDPDTMTIYDQVCDVLDINFICEVTPKDFSIGDDNIFNLNATATAWDTIRVTWNVSEYNCDVIAYNIYYLDTFMGGKPMHALVYGGEVDSYELTMLQPSTRYSISVSAERTDEELPQVGPVYVTTPEGPCPAYYESSPNGRCYRFVTSQYGSFWSDGRSGCEDSDPDSDLVVIDDQMELDFIVNRTKEFDSLRDWWIGFSDFSVESDWRWVTCDNPTDWQKTIWEIGYPRNGLHDCGALSSDSGQVIDDVCDNRNYYICELTPKGFTNADMNVYQVMASPMSSSEIQVSWIPSNVTCNVYGYKIYYGMQGQPFDVTQFHLVYGGNMTSKMVPDLSPSTTYEFHVAALIPDRLELPMMGPANATTYSECGRTIVDKDGMIMNVDYPNGYAGPETCEWLISAPIDQYVLLQILDFDTRAGTDFVVIGSGLDFASETTLYVLSGSKANAGSTPIPDKILSPEQHLWISFKTSESTLDHAGFQMAVTIVTQGPGTPERQYDEISEEGTLSSPGWPDNYQNFMDLTWTLIAPKTGRVRITSMEGFLETNYDTLTIGYGNPDSSVINSYTGEFKLTETLESPTYNFWVRFQADETVSDKGFTLYWESFDDQESCGTQELLEGSGSVMSPNFPEPYPDNQECTWYIRLPSMDHLVRAEFTAFSLEENHDFLVVGAGKTINEEVIAILTGDSLPAPIESTSYRMWLQFKSDESFSASGFSLEYTSIENPDPPTQYNEITDTVVFIVQDEPIGWFTPTRQQDLANAIATSMTDYCMDKSDTCEEIASVRRRRDAGILQLTFSEEDVEFLDTVAVENNLHITTWVRNPSMVDEDVVMGIEPEIVQTSLMEETSQATFKDIMGESFAYSVTPNVQDPTEGPGVTEPPVEGLEPWAIALIVVASFAVVVTAVVGLEVRHRRKVNRSSYNDVLDAGSQQFVLNDASEPDYAVPLKHSERSSVAAGGQEYMNDGFEGENTKL